MRPDHENEKIVNIEERIPKIKEQRKQKANRRLISFILLFFIMVLIIIYLQTPISKISSLTITGNEHVSTKQLVKLSQIKEGETEFWNLNKDITTDHIKQNKLIKSVIIKKHFPNKVSIAVKEYANIAYLQKGNLYYELLENGTALPEEVTPSHAGPIFVDWDNKEKLKQTVKSLNKLPASIQELISEVYYVPTSSNQWLVKFYMNDGNTVIASIKTFADKMRTYPAIVKELSPSEKGTIHMEVATYFESFKSKKKEDDR
ncbi:dihydropteridine reductase [Bacillus australimaris]|uniref:Cell division protein DivIB n=1 Tax=Bacillus australimaris TaxID=1326968 RepID=A0ABD4QJR5_9BACI|nr:cell division protein FtsQ/DivIB [Bacillus australimaris]KPN13566.1 dihydropteridine reductase [Bacillus australimaris]MBR8690704.1 cell division protein FtsQ/DivIB [Bacillus australimaris]